MFLIYGSTAIKYWYPDYSKIPKDLDVITNKEFKSSKEIEYYWMKEFEYLTENKDWRYVDPNSLLTIKLSHLSYDINWDKHMKDVIFLKSKGCIIDLKFYKILMKWWEKVHWKSKVNLNKINSEFFQKKITRKFDHDWLHEQVAFYDRPLHESIREDLDSPQCSEKLFAALTSKKKLECALEELYVLTLERFIFVDKPLPLNFAKTKMLKQMITSTTKWWFNLFLKENFSEILKIKPNHINIIIKKLWKL